MATKTDQLNIEHFERCIRTLELALNRLNEVSPGSDDYELFRNAMVKGFELTLETAGKLLRRVLKIYFSTPRMVDELNYKDLFRSAFKHGLIDVKAAERWFIYRDNRNDTAHDYGIAFAKDTLLLMPSFLLDAKTLLQTFKNKIESNDVGS